MCVFQNLGTLRKRELIPLYLGESARWVTVERLMWEIKLVLARACFTRLSLKFIIALKYKVTLNSWKMVKLNFFFFKSEYCWFTMLYQFLLFSKMTQSYTHIHSFLYSFPLWILNRWLKFKISVWNWVKLSPTPSSSSCQSKPCPGTVSEKFAHSCDLSASCGFSLSVYQAATLSWFGECWCWVGRCPPSKLSSHF